MRVVAQRVTKASVSIGGKVKSHIGCGMMVLLGIDDADTADDVEWLCGKLAKMRIFADENDAMNLDISQADGSFLVVSQFTLHALTKKGNRPSFIRAARPEQASPLYDYFNETLRTTYGLTVETGRFGADMKVDFINDGPVTILLDTDELK